MSFARTKIVRTFDDAPLRKRAAAALGGCLTKCLSERAHSVEYGERIGSTRVLDRLIRQWIRAQAVRHGDHKRLRDLHRRHWISQGNSFGDGYAHRFTEQFLLHDSVVMGAIGELSEKSEIEHVVELGCGNGLVLQHLAERMPHLTSLTGIDIDARRIAANQAVCKNARVQFESADLCDWFRMNAGPNRLILTNGGVLEYLLNEELRRLFELAADHRPIFIALIETIGADHDLAHDTESHFYGRELSFSHNYPDLLRKSGFSIHHQSERVGQNNDRWIRLVALAT